MPPLRLLLIAPHGSYRTADYLAAAARLGAAAVVASEGRHAITTATVSGIEIQLDQPEAALATLSAAHHQAPFSAILGCDDACVELASRLCQRLGLPHNDPAAARLTARKDLARARLAEAALAVPGHRTIRLDRPLAPQLTGLSYPVVAKPVSLSASRGVIRADDQGQLLAALARIEGILRRTAVTGEAGALALVERFVPGVEIAVEGLLQRGTLQLLAVFDKPEPLNGPFFEESYYITPSRLPAPLLDQARRLLEQACAAYGLREGPIHAECRVGEAGVVVLEIAARTIGGLCARLFTYGTGSSLEEVVLNQAFGRQALTRPLVGGAGVLMIPIPQAGVLRRVEGIPAARRVAGVEEVIITVREGYELVPLPEGESYLGFIFARGRDAAAAEAALRAAHACLNIVVAPLWKGVVA